MPRQRREKTDDQIAAEKRRRADARRLKRAQETSEQRAERLAQDRESRRTRRQQDTDQVRDARIVSDREAKRAYRAAEEPPEARAERVIKGRQAQRKRRETETPEDGAQRRGKDREAKRARRISADWVPIGPRSINVTLCKSTGVACKRTHFPLVQASAITIHKSQGATYGEVVYSYDTAHPLRLVYVALSRATSLDGLFLTNKHNDFRFYHTRGAEDRSAA
ncbi:hypothetical protein HPB49_012561 [Dermacentor silvarum]|uniref:Uncharacterized protein n=1 Tax=Dermacentor silvarum TaxID=543639 RepID=A0ACB8DDB9_DERSI|nr:hypothetical protein HPB49_012561 [Dermacentor silvarum]